MKYRIFYWILGIIVLTSCENESFVKNSSLHITTDIITRSVIESASFANGDQIGVYTPNISPINVLATYDNKWILKSEISLIETPTPVYAYYPYTEDYDGHTIKVNIIPDAVVTGQADYLYGKSAEEVSAASPEAFIRFNHALARITLSIKRNTDDAGYGRLSNVCLQNTGKNTVISTSGQMNIMTGTISSTKAGYLSLNVNYTLDKEMTQNVDILVIPTAMEKEGMAELALTIDGSQYIVKMPAATWEAGQQYTYPITINRTDAHIEAAAQIGDYYYNDNTWSTVLDENKTCVGIVFALSHEKDGNIDITLNESIHGRIVALQDIGSYRWGPASDIKEIPNVTFLAYDNITYKRCYLPVDGQVTYHEKATEDFILPYNFSNWPTESGEYYGLTDYDGRKHTSYIKTEEYPAAYACYTCTTGGVNNGFWYLPAVGEFARLAMSMGIGKVCHDKQSIFTDLRSNGTSLNESYWTSTEFYELYGVYDYNIMLGKVDGSNRTSIGSNNTKNTSLHVRPISSF